MNKRVQKKLEKQLYALSKLKIEFPITRRMLNEAFLECLEIKSGKEAMRELAADSSLPESKLAELALLQNYN